jgi:hypothetical protein
VTSNEDKVVQSTRNVVSLFEERVAASLPSSIQDFSDVINQFSQQPISHRPKKNKDDIAMALARKSLTARTVDWIVSEGKCLDHLIPDASTIRDAGRGAFAQRFIPRGSMVVPAPVIQIAEASGLNMYDFTTGEKVGTQLLINYCFSHPGTSLLLCPQTNAILINHCSTRDLMSYGGDCERYNRNNDENLRGPNAYIRWATSWDPETVKALNMTIGEIFEKTREGKRLLSMEVIASRDIYPGDEVSEVNMSYWYYIHLFSTPNSLYLIQRSLSIMERYGKERGKIMFRVGFYRLRPCMCLSNK